ncbi:mRNA cap guanine-N7 methyltransferase [Dirofilaria immitis]|nr:mRNA cap guanine-N7 methyltransferase [Dirofilaria immitis]
MAEASVEAKRLRTNETEISTEISSSTAQVADHYNAVPQRVLLKEQTAEYFIFGNFNNWIKSMLIAEFLERLQTEGCPKATVLDLCCGKGGDFLKWRIGNVAHVVAADIASISLEQCEKRYKDMKARENQRRPLFSAEFIVADATKDRLIDHYCDRFIKFDMCSCQFSFHYCFESEKQARRMIQNAVERLKPGGYFIGTLPDAERIMYYIKNSKDGTYTNRISRLIYGDVEALKNNTYRPPIFGALIHFHLIHRLLADCGLKLVYKKRFPDAFDYYINERNGRALLGRMQALEAYPPVDDINIKTLMIHTVQIDGTGGKLQIRREKLREIMGEQSEAKCVGMGTLSQDEWEIASMYLVFAFQRESSHLGCLYTSFFLFTLSSLSSASHQSISSRNSCDKYMEYPVVIIIIIIIVIVIIMIIIVIVIVLVLVLILVVLLFDMRS